MTISGIRLHRRDGWQWPALAGFGAVVACVALIGVLGVSGTQAEYESLDQPAWAPPSWLFGPVWTILYAAIAVAGWLVWRRTGFTAALIPYAAQLVANAAWTPLFFGAGAYGWALVDIALLWVLTVATIAVFWRIHRAAAWLLVPYALWVTYATALNAAIWALNT